MFHLLILIVSSILVFTKANDHQIPKMKCLDVEIDMSGCSKGWMECAKKFMAEEDYKTLTSPDTPLEKRQEVGMKAHQNRCITVCAWKLPEGGMINEDGTYNKASCDNMIDSKFPEAARDGLKTQIEKCHSDHSKEFKDDNNCEGYKGFEQCIVKTYMDVCKTSVNPYGA